MPHDPAALRTPTGAPDVEEFLDRFAPELKPPTRDPVLPYAVTTAAALFSLGIAFASASESIPMILIAVFGLGAVAAGELATRLLHRCQVARFGRAFRDRPERLYDAITAKFRGRIEAQRKRTLGPTSEWQRARTPLQAAHEEAKRSAAYWHARLKHEVPNELARTQLMTALSLESKFANALNELDRRSDALVAFFNDCDAKLATMERSGQDIQESRRLSALSSQAKILVANAEAVLISIGRQFVTEAVRVGEALGELERIHIKQTAADVPLEELEMVADRIIASAEHEHETLSRLFAHIASADQYTVR